jgi:hypothetical protein
MKAAQVRFHETPDISSLKLISLGWDGDAVAVHGDMFDHEALSLSHIST